MKKIASLILLCGSYALLGAEKGVPSLPCSALGFEKIHLIDASRGVMQTPPLASSPSNSVAGILSMAASLFSTSVPAQETEKDKIARSIRDAVLTRNDDQLSKLFAGPLGVECAEMRGPDKYNAFQMACRNQYMSGIDILTQKKKGRKININAGDGNAQTPLHVALSEGHVDVAKKLVELGVPVDDEEISIVRALRRDRGKEDEVVEQLANLLAEKKREAILKDIYHTDSDEADVDEQK